MNFCIRAQGGATRRFERFSQNAIYQLIEPIYFDDLLHKVPLKSFKLQFKPKTNGYSLRYGHFLVVCLVFHTSRPLAATIFELDG